MQDIHTLIVHAGRRGHVGYALCGTFALCRLRAKVRRQPAAAEATRRRFRPILMTSFTFILGVTPLMIAFGAGAASQQAVGTVVFGGMLASTLLAIPFVPVFYVLSEKLSERFRRKV